jgi:C1A family cysteine protease
MKRVYGWKRDLPSQVPWFDHPLLVARTPDVVDNRASIKWVYDQLQEGSCTANSAMGTNRFVRAVKKMPDFLGSRQFLYYVTRSLEGSTKSDSGATIADTVTAEVKFGICLETLWSYSKALTAKPSVTAYADGLNHQVLIKQPVQQTQAALEACLTARQPLHYGMTVYDSFESNTVAKSGVVPLPKRSESALGGHALWLHSYDRTKKLFYGQNSWGPQWGQGKMGIFSIPYAYILDPDMASDFWTVTDLEI